MEANLRKLLEKDELERGGFRQTSFFRFQAKQSVEEYT
jgi:hypothetical protein